MNLLNLSHIFRLFKKGDLKPFYEMVYPGLLTFASRQLGDGLAYLSEDVVQDAVFDSYSNRGSFESPLAWMSYIHKSILHGTIHFIRKNNSRQNYLEKKVDDDFASGHDVEILEKEVLDMLYAALNNLSPRQREVLRLTYIDGLKNSEIAVHFGVAEITVKKWKSTILSELRDLMRDDPDIKGRQGYEYILILVLMDLIGEASVSLREI